MSESELSQELYNEFLKINRYLTYGTVAFVCVVAFVVWIFDIDLGGQRTSLMGLMFMLLAVVTFKIPYISYRYLRKKYKNHAEKNSILGVDWKLFRDAAMMRK